MLRQPAVRAAGLRARARGHLPHPAVDRGRVPGRRDAAAAQARHRRARDRRRVRHVAAASATHGITPLRGPVRPEPLVRQRDDALLPSQGLGRHRLSLLRPAVRAADPEDPRGALSGAAAPPDLVPRRAHRVRARAAVRSLREVPAHRGHALRHGRRSAGVRLFHEPDRGLPAHAPQLPAQAGSHHLAAHIGAVDRARPRGRPRERAEVPGGAAAARGRGALPGGGDAGGPARARCSNCCCSTPRARCSGRAAFGWSWTCWATR